MRFLAWMTAVWLCACDQGPSGGADAAAGADAGPPTVDASSPSPDAAGFRCEELPIGPLAPTSTISAVNPVEDLAFDLVGNLYWSDAQHLYKSDQAGTRQVFAANLSAREGMRFLPSGDLMVADLDGGALLRIEPSGARHTVISGLVFPDGIEIGKDGHVYLTDLSAGKVYRIDPMSGQYTVLVDNMDSPNGLTFNQDYTALYLAGLSGEPTVWRLPIAADGTPGTLEVYVTGVGSGVFDGIEVDACGNLYICDLDDSKIYRVHPDKIIEVLVDRSEQKSYMPNLQWGRGQGGWDAQTLYIIDVDAGVLAVPVGVPGKPR